MTVPRSQNNPRAQQIWTHILKLLPSVTAQSQGHREIEKLHFLQPTTEIVSVWRAMCIVRGQMCLHALRMHTYMQHACVCMCVCVCIRPGILACWQLPALRLQEGVSLGCCRMNKIWRACSRVSLLLWCNAENISEAAEEGTRQRKKRNRAVLFF